ncbi:MAG: hypothetical protein ACRCTP_02180 [Aeromonas popoffii]|uniref:hypothetical protein n=1 Tax=Aeromonas popoffii TaxID=70856 RepID=UPI003F37DF38
MKSTVTPPVMPLVPLHFNQAMKVIYTNWKGKTRERTIIPTAVFFGETPYHPETQWLVEAVDTEDHEVKMFAMKDMVIPVELYTTGHLSTPV